MDASHGSSNIGGATHPERSVLAWPSDDSDGISSHSSDMEVPVLHPVHHHQRGPGVPPAAGRHGSHGSRASRGSVPPPPSVASANRSTSLVVQFGDMSYGEAVSAHRGSTVNVAPGPNATSMLQLLRQVSTEYRAGNISEATRGE